MKEKNIYLFILISLKITTSNSYDNSIILYIKDIAYLIILVIEKDQKKTIFIMIIIRCSKLFLF